MRKSALMVTLAMALALTACQPTASTGGEANTPFCASLQALDSAVATVKALSTSSTVEQVRTAAEDVRTAWSAVTTAAQSVRDISLDDTKAAYDEIDTTMSGVTDTSTLASAITRLQAAVTRFETASATLNRTICRAAR